MARLLKGNGRFDFQVVGESFRQPAFKRLIGDHGSEGCEVECLAALILDDANAFDAMAVAVAVVRRSGAIEHVGYLAREDARLYRLSLASVGGADPTGMLCRAIMNGGMVRPSGSRGKYGIRLDLILPIGFRTVAAWKNWERRLL